jgi:hypothetical protein
MSAARSGDIGEEGRRSPRPMYPWLICGPNGRLIGDHQLGHATPASRARAPVAADRRR